jgi:hypothetical protein
MDVQVGYAVVVAGWQDKLVSLNASGLPGDGDFLKRE